MAMMTLKAARVNADLTQLEVANRLHVSPTTVSAWESGQNDIKASDFKQLCDLYRVSMNDIMLPTESTK